VGGGAGFPLSPSVLLDKDKEQTSLENMRTLLNVRKFWRRNFFIALRL
jgi:hypothetical protein